MTMCLYIKHHSVWVLYVASKEGLP